MPTLRTFSFEKNPQDGTYSLILEVNDFDTQGGRFAMSLLDGLDEADKAEIAPKLETLPEDGYTPGSKIDRNSDLLPHAFVSYLERKESKLSARQAAPREHLSQYELGRRRSLSQQVTKSAEALYAVAEKGSLPKSAFRGHASLLVFSPGRPLTVIPEEAFEGCPNLREVKLSPALASIGSFAFRGCSSLRGKLVLPANVTSIDAQAFASSGFSHIVLTGKIEKIGTLLFTSSPHLRTMTISGALPGKRLGITALHKEMLGCRSRLTIHCSEANYRLLLEHEIKFSEHVCVVTKNPAGGQNFYYPHAQFQIQAEENLTQRTDAERVARCSRNDEVRWLFIDEHFNPDFMALNNQKKLEYIAQHYPSVMAGDLLVTPGLKALYEKKIEFLSEQVWDGTLLSLLPVSQAFLVINSYQTACEKSAITKGVFFTQTSLTQGMLTGKLIVDSRITPAKLREKIKANRAQAKALLEEADELEAMLKKLEATAADEQPALEGGLAVGMFEQGAGAAGAAAAAAAPAEPTKAVEPGC